MGERMGLDFTNPVERREDCDLCLCLGCDGVGGVRWSGWVASAKVWGVKSRLFV